MTEILGIQLWLFVLLVFIGIIIGGVVAARHYKHVLDLREAEELGRKKEITRLPPPTDYELLLKRLSTLCNDPNVESYEIRAYGETFTFLSQKG